MEPSEIKPGDTGTSQNTKVSHIPSPDPLAEETIWITVDEAVLLFRELGLPRSPEAIRGYCRDGKLEAKTTQGIKGEQHVIERKSAEIYIEDRKKVLASMSRDIPEDAGISRKVPVTSVTSRQMTEDAGTTRQAEKGDVGTSAGETTAAETEALKARDAEIVRLREENTSLKIDKAARDQIVTMLREERGQLAAETMEKSRRVGELETRLELQLPEAHRSSLIPRAGDYPGDVRGENERGEDHESEPEEHDRPDRNRGDSRFDAGRPEGV